MALTHADIPMPVAGQDASPERSDHRIVVSGLSKRFGPVRAVEDLSFTVEAGSITGFIGPNGAGKTTTLRCILGLVTPTAGQATIGGRSYRDLPLPMHTVGAALEASSFHPGRTARNHLRVLTAEAGLPDDRVDVVLQETALDEVADRRVGGYSTGMRQRLGLAAALLGDPSVLVLDEPASGLDPAGINWLRQLLRYLARARGKTVLISSHLLSEMEHTADRIVIIARGRLIREGPLEEIIAAATRTRVEVRTPDPARLLAALTPSGLRGTMKDGAVLIPGATASQIGHLAFVEGIELHELAEQRSDLEQVFLELTGGEPKGGEG